MRRCRLSTLLVYIGGVLSTDSHANSLLATHSVAISPVSPIYSFDPPPHHHQHHHHHHQQHHQQQLDFTRGASPPLMPATVDALAAAAAGSPVDDARLPCYAAPTPLDAAFCSPPAPAATLPPLVGVDDERPASNPAAAAAALHQLMHDDYVTAPRAAPGCAGAGPGVYGHLPGAPPPQPPARVDIYRPLSAAPHDPFMYRAFPLPPLKSELV